jgi:hypothetical protein
MVGDGTCDEACNVEECSYDLTDCCNCTDEELGQCKTECLSSSCAYDAGCDDDFMKDSAKYQQLIRKDFSAQLDFEECYNTDSTCTLDDLRAFYAGSAEDLDKCKPLECFSQYGQGKCCPDEMHCRMCIGERCLECEDGYVNHYTSCLEVCPVSFTTQSKVPGICFRKRYLAYTDNTSDTFYKFVDINSNGDNLAESLADIWQAYTNVKIYVPSVKLSPMTEAFMKASSSVSIYSPLQKTISLNRKSIIIESNDCFTYAGYGCLQYWPEIIVSNRLMTFVVEGFKLMFRNVKITGYYAFKSTCADVTCSYCPYLTKYQDSYFDDRFVKYDERPDWGECEDSACPFIKVDGKGSLDIKNLEITHFRLQQSAFIEAEGPVAIAKATFNNVSSAGSGDGFIVQKCKNYGDCSISLQSIFVSYFNNGYEIRDDLEQSSFLTSTKSTQVTISFSQFYSITVHSSNNAALLNIIDPLGQVTLTNTDFSVIATSGPLISIRYLSLVTQEPTLDADNFSVESTTPHIELNTLRIINVTAQTMVEVNMQTKLKNIKIKQATIYSSLATESLINLAYLDEVTDSDINGATATTVLNGVPRIYHVKPISCVYRDISVFNSAWNNYAFKSSSLVNEELFNIMIGNSGQFTGDLRDFTYKPLVEDPNFYLSMLPYLDNNVKCRGTLTFVDSINLQLHALIFDGVTCSGNTGLEASVLSDVTVDLLTSDRAVYPTSSTSAAVLSLTSGSSSTFKASIFNILVQNLKSQGAGALSVSGLDVSLKSSAFSRIDSAYTAGLSCIDCSGLIIDNCEFSDLTTSSSTGACVSLSLKSVSHEVKIQDSSFSKCVVNKYQGGAFYFFSTSSPVTLALSRLTFSQGSSLQSASAIYIGTSFVMTDLSSITDCTFTGHRDQGANLIELKVGSSFAFKSCRFTDNSHRESVVNISYSSTGHNQVSLYNCTFNNNQVTSVMLMVGQDPSQQFSMEKVTMSNNQAKLMSASSLNVFASDSLFTRGTNGMHLTDTSTIKLVSTTFSYMNSTESSAVELYSQSSLECEACTFMYNSAHSGGCIRVDGSSRMTVKNSHFSYNTGVLGSVFYLINTKLLNLVQDSEISFNYASLTSTIQALMSTITLQRVTFHSNTALQNPAILAQSSDLSLLNCTLSNQTAREVTFISVSSTSSLRIEDSSIRDGQGAAAIILVDSNMLLLNSKVGNINSRNLGFLVSVGDCEVLIENCQVNNLTALNEGAFFVSKGGSTEISSTTVSHFNSTALVVMTASKLSVKNSVFENGSCPSSCVANLQDISSIEIIDSQFRHNQGSAALLITDANESSDVTIMRSVFEHNAGTEGGALKLSVKNALVSESVFLNNTSETDGGGISTLCERVSCNYTFTHNNFTLNSAKHNGGAINWLSQPSLTNNSFTNNTAAYGPDLASFGVALKNLINYTEGRLLVVSDQPIVIASGQRIPASLDIGLTDHYGQLVKTDNSSTAEVNAPDDLTTSIAGKTRVSAKKGVYTFSEIIITANPNSKVTFEINSNAIEDQNSSADQLLLPVDFRACLPGEALVGISCVACIPGLYSLDPTQSCTDCPTGAECYGGSLMVPKQGYWRSSKTSDDFMECLVPSACLGSPHIVPSLTGECLRGYRGNLCQACDSGYSRTSQDKCAECPSKGGNIAKLLGLICIVSIVSAILVRSSLRTAYVPKAQHSIYLKIFANYLQLVLLVTQLSLEWPSFVLSFFEVQNYSGSVDQQVLSFDCYLAGDDPQGDSYKTVYFDRLILLTVLPLIISAAVLAFWLTFFFIKKRRSILRKELVATAVVLFFLVHPSLVKEYFAFFSCRRLDGSDFWLTSNLDIKCFDEQHSLYAFSVALPAILLWGLGVPSFILGILVKRRKKLGTLLMKCRFGFFYNGFKKTHFYWEFLILYRKIIIINLVVFVGNQSIPIQALSIMVILLVFLALQFWQQPYTSAALNTMELRAILVAGITIYCGLYYLTGSSSEGFKVVLFIMIVVVNSYFIYNFLHELLKTLLQLFATHFRLFRRFALKQDLFPTTDIASANLANGASYLESDNSGKVQTLVRLSEACENVPHAYELDSLYHFFSSANPTDSFSSRGHRESTLPSKDFEFSLCKDNSRLAKL